MRRERQPDGDSLAMRITVQALTRAVYFVGGLFAPMAAYIYMVHEGGWWVLIGPGGLYSLPFFWISLTSAVASAAVGPQLYACAVNRGRGTLRDVRDRSRE